MSHESAGERHAFSREYVWNCLVQFVLSTSCLIQPWWLQRTMTCLFLYQGFWNSCCKQLRGSCSSHAVICEVAIDIGVREHIYLIMVFTLFSPRGFGWNQRAKRLGSRNWLKIKMLIVCKSWPLDIFSKDSNMASTWIGGLYGRWHLFCYSSSIVLDIDPLWILTKHDLSKPKIVLCSEYHGEWFFFSIQEDYI